MCASEDDYTMICEEAKKLSSNQEVVVLKLYHNRILLSLVGYIILQIVTKENFKKLNILFRKS